MRSLFMFSSINLEPFRCSPTISRHFEFHFFLHAPLVFNQASSFLLFPYFRWLRFKFHFEASAEHYNEQRMNLIKRHNKEFFQVVFRPVTKAMKKDLKSLWRRLEKQEIRGNQFPMANFSAAVFDKNLHKIRNSLGAKITTINYFCSDLIDIFCFLWLVETYNSSQKKQNPTKVWNWRSVHLDKNFSWLSRAKKK